MHGLFKLQCPILFIALILTGCGGKEDFGKPKNARRDDNTGTDNGKNGDKPKEGMKPIKGTGLATLTGMIKYEGEKPDYEALTARLLAEIDKATADRPVCLQGGPAEKTQYTWVVDEKSQGVDNVFVWMRPENEKTEFFDVTEMVKEGKGFEKYVIIDQPHCAFMPHSMLLFPRYVDPEKPSIMYRLTPAAGGPPATSQQFIVKNSGPLNHNTSTDGDRSRMKGINRTVPPKGQITIDDIQPFYRSPVQVKCSIHPWMQSWIWAFDHPFACISGSKVGEKQLKPGEYRIEGIPAGVKLRIVAWHEGVQFLNGERGEEIILQEGENTRDFTITYKK